ncbi:MAG: endonuclease III [Candidatus Methanomethylophilaceae archaeon]
MAESKMTVVLDILSGLYQEGVYPGRSDQSGPPSWPRDPFHVLIATVLSQRTRDENTRRAADQLFRSYPDLNSMAEAEATELESLIRPAGFPRQKAKAIRELCRHLRDESHGQVPADMDSLLQLPMVGRKTANCVLAYGFGQDAICVDTHVHRICNLMGEVDTKTPDETEAALRAQVPQERWRDINRYLVRHGQVVCLPGRERCQECAVLSLCRHGLEGGAVARQ